MHGKVLLNWDESRGSVAQIIAGATSAIAVFGGANLRQFRALGVELTVSPAAA